MLFKEKRSLKKEKVVAWKWNRSSVYVENLLVSHESDYGPKIFLGHESPNKMFLTEWQTADGVHNIGILNLWFSRLCIERHRTT